MPRKGGLFVVSAPSGAGKTTLCRGLMEPAAPLEYSISYTTREPREGEVQGRDYNFVSRETFESLVSQSAMAEWAVVHGHFYGTPKPAIDAVLDSGRDLLADVDVQGSVSLKKNYPEAVRIFILPPSMEELARRLHNRGKDSQEVVAGRLAAARKEIEAAGAFDYAVVNDRLEQALNRLVAIITAHRCRVENSLDLISKLTGP